MVEVKAKLVHSEEAVIAQVVCLFVYYFVVVAGCFVGFF